MAHIVAQLPITYTLTGSARNASASPASDAFLEPKIVSSANGIIDYTFGNKITTITGAKLTTIGGVGANANTLVAASIVLKIGAKDIVLTFSSLNEWEKKEISLQTNDYDQMKIMSTSEISVDDYNVQDAFVGESITAKLELIMD